MLLIFHLLVTCQLHLFLASVLRDKNKKGKQITAEAHLPIVSSCRQQSSLPAAP